MSHSFISRYSFLPALPLLLAAPAALAQDAYLQNIYQDADYLQRGLFEAPLPSLSPDQERAKGHVDKWTDMLRFSLSAGVRYDDNIYLTSDDEEDDVIFSVSPTLALRSGEAGTALNTFTLSYTPTFNVYSSNSDNNTVDHRVAFRYGREMPKSKLGLSLDYSHNSGSDRFVSGTVDRDSLRGALDYNYILSGKTRLDLMASTDLDVFDTEGLNDNKRFDLRASLMYQWTGKTSIGPSVSYAHTNTSNSPDQDMYEIGAKFEYEVSGKTSVVGTMGYNVMTFDGTNAADDEKTFAWSIAGNYQFSAKTSLRASFYSAPKASYNFDDTGYTATGISLTGSHQYSPRTNLYARFSFENDDYYETRESTGINMDNDYWVATLGSSYLMQNGISLGANVTWRTNDADYSENDFDNFTVGLNGSYNFW